MDTVRKMGFTPLLADVQQTVTHLDEVIHSLEELSTRDGLTGVYNRRACEERLAEEVPRVERGNETLTIAALDTDRLKEINDRHGHDAGDACLKHLVSTVEHNIRQGDWLGRWGGDEFVVVLWDAEDPPGPAAHAIVERIADDLKERPARLPQGEHVSLTLSGGIASHREREGARELFGRADGALLEAKRQGRGRIVEAA
jgi:diguanylate cyclase (GGDEF)-like protein